MSNRSRQASCVIAMAKGGMPPRDIAGLLGITPASASGTVRYYRGHGEDIPKCPSGKPKSRHYDDIVALALQRVRPAEIAQQLKLPADAVYYQLQVARAAGLDIPKFTTGPITGARRLNIPSGTTASGANVRELLKPKADARGISVVDLAGRILMAVVEDDLIDAVLDDEEEFHA